MKKVAISGLSVLLGMAVSPCYVKAEGGSDDYAVPQDVLWRAEGKLVETPENTPNQLTNGLLRGLGDWWESYDGCLDNDLKCDEVISFNRIDRDNPAFDASVYSETSDYRLFWLRTNRTPHDGYYGEVLMTSGDITSEPEGYLLVLWRNMDGGEKITNGYGLYPYQGLAYNLDMNTGEMKIAWGNSDFDPNGVGFPEIPTAGTPCDGVSVTCHTGWNENIKLSNIEGHLESHN